MLTDDINFYLKEFKRVLSTNGAIYLTAFTEYNVENVIENPKNYIAESKGALHRIRYNVNYLKTLIENQNLMIVHFLHQHIERTKQSVYILKPINKKHSNLDNIMSES